MNKYEVRKKDGTIKCYDFVSRFNEGFAAVKIGCRWGFINMDGDEICPIKYSFSKGNQLPGAFFEGYAMVGIPEGNFLRFGYINTKGEEVCPFVYTGACDFKNGLAIVRDENFKWSVINKDFKQITQRTYDRIYDYRFGYAVVKLNGLFGFINEAGEEMCEIKYEYMSSFNKNGYATINIPGKTFDRVYYIDAQGKEYYMYFDSNEMEPLN